MNKFFSRFALPLCLGAGAVTAHATNIVEIDGAHTSYFYDSDIWGVGTATVTGDTLSFALGDDYTLNAKVTPGMTSREKHIANGSDPAGIVAVAKTGYLISTTVTPSLQGSFHIADQGGTILAINKGYVLSGSYNGSKFIAASNNAGFFDGRKSAYSGAISPGQSHAGNFDTLRVSNWGTVSTAGAIWINPSTVSSEVRQVGTGESGVALTDISYTFQVTPVPQLNSVSAVPEPATYGMFVAGLALLGLSRRRRA